MGVSDSGIGSGRQFPATSWSILVAARDPGSPEHARRLQSLVERYWKPVFTTIRHSWAKSPDDAKDLTQQFFMEAVLDGNLLRTFAPERGSFRTFLRRSINYFMCQETRDAGRLKRGGDLRFISLDAVEPALELSGHHVTPEQAFDAAWNKVVMARALQMLKDKLAADGKAWAFDLFERYDLDAERKSLSYADLGRERGLSAAQVKHALLHARGMFRDLVVEVVREYCDGPETLEAELELLLSS